MHHRFIGTAYRIAQANPKTQNVITDAHMDKYVDDIIESVQKQFDSGRYINVINTISALTAIPEKFLKLDKNESKFNNLVKTTMKDLKIESVFDAFYLSETSKKIQKSPKLSLKILREF